MAGVAVTAMLAVAACGGGGGSDSGGGSSGGSGGGGGSQDNGTLTVWTTEDVAERVTAQQKIMDAWSAKSGTKVKLVAVAEDQLTTVLTSAAAANDLPDVIGALSLNGMNQLRTDDLVDPDAAKEIVDGLGADTFFKRTLELTSVDGEQIAVPSDGFSNLLFYRKDLLKAAGLPEPKTYADIQNAAKQLHKGKMAGIVAATAPSDSFTDQTFEWVALANGCQLVDNSAKIMLNSPQCQEAFNFYANLIKDTSVKGNQDADTTRATYFAGDAAMVMWSSFLLDELAGLRNDAQPTCAQCKKDPEWLAKNTGILTQMQGPSGPTPAAWGEVVSWNVLKDANPKAKDFVTYMMTEGYLPWLGIAPEGKIPARSGTAENPKEYADGWIKLSAGVDKKELLTKVYPAEVLNTIVASSGNFERWGIPENQGALAAAVAGQYVVPQALGKMLNSGASAADAANEAQKGAEQVQKDLGG